MLGRVIIRFSIDGERNGLLRNAGNKILEESGFARTNTGTIELGTGMFPEEIPGNKILEFLSVLFDPHAAGIDTAGSLDHVWIYIDKGN